MSFGGVYSNHLYALAAAGSQLGLQTTGIVRGYDSVPLTPTLIDAQNWGMKLHFLGKKDYRRKDITGVLPILKKYSGNYYLLPEGGENLAGVRGCMSLAVAVDVAVAEILGDTGYILCSAAGTGSTLAGLIAGASERCRCVGISVLKGEDQLTPKINHWLSLLGKTNKQWRLFTDFHHGGYGKTSPELMAFIAEFEQNNQLLLEPVYTAKMLWAIEQLAKIDYWPENSKIVAIHSGGLQGRRGFGLSHDV